MLDASTVLCLIRNEPGADAVKAVLADSSISAVNLSEVIAKIADLGMNAGLIEALLGPSQLPALPFDAAQARLADSFSMLVRRARTAACGHGRGGRGEGGDSSPFLIAIPAAIGGKVIARETVCA